MFDWLDTPQLLIEDRIFRQNLHRMQTLANQLGKRLRPHTKTHKSPEFAREQIRLGADGIMVAKLDEASVMLSGGIAEQSVGYPLIGRIKAVRLAELMLRGLKPRVSVDSDEGILLLEAVGTSVGQVIDVLIEVDTGLRRAGLADLDAVVGMAKMIASQGHVHFKGLTCFGGHIGKQATIEATIAEVQAEDRMLAWLVAALGRSQLDPEVVSEGGTIPAAFAEYLRTATEIRPGTYIYNDVATVEAGAATFEQCAASILTTVVSTPDPHWAVIDAGSKTLSSDGTRGGGYGHVVGRQNLRVERLSEEHGIVARSDGGAVGLKVGDRLRIIPNHVCTAVNLHRHALAVDGDNVLRSVAIAAQGGIH